MKSYPPCPQCGRAWVIFSTDPKKYCTCPDGPTAESVAKMRSDLQKQIKSDCGTPWARGASKFEEIMTKSTSKFINELNFWENVVWENEPDFLEKFCHNAHELMGVYWCAEKMKVYYFVDDYQQVTDSVPMREWLDWLESKVTGRT